MKCKKILSVFCILSLCISIWGSSLTLVTAAEENEISITAQSAIVVDLDHNQILFEKESAAPISQSFLANLMTTVIAVDTIAPGTLITASTNAVLENTEDVQLQAGSIYVLEELLSASILTLSDNAAVTLYEAIDADREKFVAQMNSKASSLSMTDTTFAYPFGNKDNKTETTAKDIASIMQYAYDTTAFHDIFCSNIQFVSEEINEKEFLKNSNDMLWRYSYAIGGLASLESEESISAITYVNRNDMHFLIILLNSDVANNGYIADTAALSDYVVTSFEKNTLAVTGQVLHDTTIAGETISLIAANDVTYLAPFGKDFISNANVLLIDNLTAPIKAGDYVGSMRYTLDDNTVIHVSLLAQTGVYSSNATLNDMLETLAANQEITAIICIVLTLVLILAIYHLVKYIQKKAKHTK